MGKHGKTLACKDCEKIVHRGNHNQLRCRECAHAYYVARTRVCNHGPLLLEVLEGMLLSYEVIMGPDSPLPQMAKECVRGAFLLDPEKARAAIAKARNQGQPLIAISDTEKEA